MHGVREDVDKQIVLFHSFTFNRSNSFPSNFAKHKKVNMVHIKLVVPE
jgi:hypothetical protein